MLVDLLAVHVFVWFVCHQERDRLQLTRAVVFELTQALKFKSVLPDENLLLLVQVTSRKLVHWPGLLVQVTSCTLVYWPSLLVITVYGTGVDALCENDCNFVFSLCVWTPVAR